MRYLVILDGEFKEVSWVIWLRFHHCAGSTYETTVLLLRGGEMPGGPALFMRPLPNYCIIRQSPYICRPTNLDITDLTHSYRDGLPPHLKQRYA